MLSLSRLLVGAVVVAAVLSPVPAAEARPAEQAFRGICELALTVTHRPPLRGTPSTGAAKARGRGTCSGELISGSGRSWAVEESPAAMRASGAGDLSCAGGHAAGEGVLKIRGARIGFAFEEVRGPGTATLRYEGAAGGSAVAVAHLSAEQDPVGSVSACADNGLRRVRVSVRLISADLAG